jgi:hypothetical protein
VAVFLHQSTSLFSATALWESLFYHKNKEKQAKEVCGLHERKLCGLQPFARFRTIRKGQMSFRVMQENLKREKHGCMVCGLPAVSHFFPAYPYLFGNRNPLLTFASEINNNANKTTTKNEIYSY